MFFVMPVVYSRFDFMYDDLFWKSLSLYIPEMRFNKVFVSYIPVLRLQELLSER